MEAGQQSDDAGRCLPSTVVIRSGRCPGVKGGAFGGGFAQALAGQAEALPAGDLPTVIPLFAGTVASCATGTAA